MEFKRSPKKIYPKCENKQTFCRFQNVIWRTPKHVLDKIKNHQCLLLIEEN